jgi:hypothetical protein
MSDTSDSDYILEDTDSDMDGYTTSNHNTTEKELSNQEKQIKALLELGELRTENIIEIQMIEELIKKSEYEDDRKISMGKCLELLINCSNAHLNKMKDNL